MQKNILTIDTINQQEVVKKSVSSFKDVKCVGFYDVISTNTLNSIVNGKYNYIIISANVENSLTVIDTVRKCNRSASVIVACDILDGNIQNYLNSSMPDFFLNTDYDVKEVTRAIETLGVSREMHYVECEINDILHNMGVSSAIKGFGYLRDAIKMLYFDEDLVGSMTKTVYPTIAKNHGTLGTRVERAVRHAIEVSWCRSDYGLSCELFGSSMEYDKDRPTNTEYISTIADYIRVNRNK